MAARAHEPIDPPADGEADPDHDAFVRAKVARGLAQSRDRSAMIPVEQVWRDFGFEC